jgi:hypothetical protein
MKELDGEYYTTKEYHHELRIRTLVNMVAQKKDLNEEQRQEAREELEEKSREEVLELLYARFP